MDDQTIETHEHNANEANNFDLDAEGDDDKLPPQQDDLSFSTAESSGMHGDGLTSQTGATSQAPTCKPRNDPEVVFRRWPPEFFFTQ